MTEGRADRPALGARWALRDATRHEHDQVDAAFSTHDLSTIDGYGRFLSAQSRAFIAIERAADAAGAGALIADWDDRRRADLLLDDLADLGMEAPASIAPPVITSDAEILGAVYVLEGSRLGGAVLFRSAPFDAPRRFLEPDGAGPRWRSLVALMDARLTDDREIEAAVQSARAVFNCFHQAAEAEAA